MFRKADSIWEPLFPLSTSDSLYELELPSLSSLQQGCQLVGVVQGDSPGSPLSKPKTPCNCPSFLLVLVSHTALKFQALAPIFT